MRVWRLARRKFSRLDGDGARRFGGRWNSKGTPAVYASEHLSLAVLEFLVHVDPDELPDDLLAYEIDVPDDIVVDHLATIPPDWDSIESPESCRDAGSDWLLSCTSLALAVPSVVIPRERNYMLNPRHPDIDRVRVISSKPFRFDERFMTLVVSSNEEHAAPVGAASRKAATVVPSAMPKKTAKTNAGAAKGARKGRSRRR